MPGSKGKVPSVQQSVAIEGQIDGSVQAHKSSIEGIICESIIIIVQEICWSDTQLRTCRAKTQSHEQP